MASLAHRRSRYERHQTDVTFLKYGGDQWPSFHECHSMHQSRFRLPLIVAALALAQAVCWGMTFNLPAITGGAMAEALDVPYFVVMMGPTVMLVLMALIAVPLLQVFQRLGMRLVMTASAGLGSIGLAIVALAMWPWAFFVGWVIVGAAGAGMLTTAVQIAIAELAGPYARRAIGALMVFGGLGTTLCWPLLGALQAAYGWRAATMLGAAALLLMAAPIYWQLLAKRSGGTATTVKRDGRSIRLDRLWPAGFQYGCQWHRDLGFFAHHHHAL